MPKTNPIWNYFVKSDSNLSKAQCNICNKLLSLGSDKAKNQTVHGLKQHLLKFHSEQHGQYLKRFVYFFLYLLSSIYQFIFDLNEYEIYILYVIINH